MSAGVLYPEIEVELTGQDGNGFFIVARTAKALRSGGVDAEDVEAFRTEAMSGSYDHLLATVQRWVSVS